MRLKSLIAVAACCAAVLPVAAQTLKPGVWEMTNKMNSPQMDGAMAEMQKQLAAMPPEQRKQMEEMMAKQGVKMGTGAGGAMTMQVCMTKEMVDRNDVPMQEGCKITQNNRTGNTTKMAFVCTKPPSSGEGTFTYNGPESYSSKVMVKTQMHGKPETMTMEGSGRWIKADCGELKPLTPAK